MDLMDAGTRSRVMSRIRGEDTKPEMLVRRYLHARGLRYALHGKHLPGKPDLVFKSRKVAVFVHGCFWHAHAKCNTWRLPQSRIEYWSEKLSKNQQRDLRNAKELRRSGWRVATVWACELNDKHLDKLFRFITTRGSGVAKTKKPIL